MNIGQTYLIQSGNRTYIWNDGRPKLFHRLFRIRKKNGSLVIEDHTGPHPIASSNQLLNPPTIHQKMEFRLRNGLIASIRLIPRGLKTSIEQASRIHVDPIPSAILTPEDQLIRKSMKAGAVLLAMIGLIFGIQSLTDPTVTPDEKLIPKKFAKMILSKPKEKSSALTKSGAAVSRSFRSQSVKKNLRTILQGGLSRYSILETGKSIREMGNRMSQQGNQAISSLGDHMNRAIGSLSTGGIRSGIGTSVQGQGTGQLEIGLNYKDANVEEGLTREEVAKVIHSHLNEIRYCYESAILHDPSLSGKVLVDFRIGLRGQVETAQSRENTMSTPTVSTCLLGKLRNWKFPSPRGQVQVAVSYPFLFKSLNR